MITINVRGFDRILKNIQALPGELQNKTLNAALNKTAASARVEMTRAITSTYNIKSNQVRNALDIRRAATKHKMLTAILRAFGSSKRKGRSLNLIHFIENKVSLAEGRRRKKSGTHNALRFKIKKTGGLKMIDGAFIGNKGRTVFVREGGVTRLPIRPLQVIDVPQMFTNQKLNQRVIAKIHRQLPVEVDRAIKAVLAGRF
jgi:hypothetical protein